ncbi:MAG: cupredoxin domain-containing protein [Chloroflexi bacterium]|nr:cupredoxin domain-containing protein [Chloroflexota bacterium]
MTSQLRVVALGAFAFAALVACAGSTTAAPPATSSAAAPATAGASAVSIKGFAFNPASLTVKAGAKITFTNNDGTTHTVTSGAPGAKTATFDNQVSAGQSAAVTIDKAGTYDFFCQIHNSMKGQIVVQ